MVRVRGAAGIRRGSVRVSSGGTSAEQTLKAVKLASTRYLDGLPVRQG